MPRRLPPLQHRVGLARYTRAVRPLPPLHHNRNPVVNFVCRHVEAVCRDGPRAFRTTDGGFFGAGSYFAVELEYATRYAMMQVRTPRAPRSRPMSFIQWICHQAPSASGEYPVILFAVSVASAYVVCPGRDYPADHPDHPELWGFSNFYSANPSRSVALMPRYNAHFVPVKYCGRAHCVTGRPLPLDTDYQAAVEGAGASELLRKVGWCAVFGAHALLLQLRTSWSRCRPSKRCPWRWFGCANEALLLHAVDLNKMSPSAVKSDSDREGSRGACFYSCAHRSTWASACAPPHAGAFSVT